MRGDRRTGTFFIAQLGTETNTFSPLPTGLRAFREGALIYRDASLSDPTGRGALLRCYRDLAQADGNAVTESVCAFAQPGGRTVRSVYERLRDRILADLRKAAPLDVVMMSMHGAMMAEGYDDCEGDMLERIREIVGPDPIVGVQLDPHCHLTQRMMRNADALVCYKLYPHTDLQERARELYGICSAAVRGEVKPVMAAFDCRMVGFFPTTPEPMASLVKRMVEAESEPGILSVSFAHGFPFGDNPETGAKMLVVADRDETLARETAERLGRAVYGCREQLLPEILRPEEALDEALSREGLVVLADRADNPGGGAPGDNTELLLALLERDAGSCAFGTIYDPQAVRVCEEARVGACLELRIGGKLGRSSGSPADLHVQVMAVVRDLRQRMFGRWVSAGPSAWVRCGRLDIVLASQRTQVLSPEAFTGLGITLDDKRIVALKSAEHFRAEFRALTSHILRVMTRTGALQMAFDAIPYRKKLDMGYHPRMADPLGAADSGDCGRGRN